jgi:hypothetical protein
MSESDYQELVERMLENTSVPMISGDTGLEAAQKIGQLAAQEGVEWAEAVKLPNGLRVVTPEWLVIL